MAKDERVYVRMTDVEKQMAWKVADALGDESMSQTMRRLLREKHRELFGSQPQARRKSKARKR